MTTLSHARAVHFTSITLVAALAVLPALAAEKKTDSLPAFPGAEGFGAVATGGRGGKVIHVTNLNPKGPGSLQWACSQKGPRIVVFDVAGVIRPGNGNKEGRWITILNGDITIAGQTAPAPGITIDGMLSTYRGDKTSGLRSHYGSNKRTENVIARFLRVRPTEGSGNLRVVEFYYCKKAIIDHISGSWGLDQCFNPGYPGGDDIFTFQWCAIEESDPAHLEKTGECHGFGFMGSWHESHVSIHHNLLAHHMGRAPLLSNWYTDFSNNVLYNMGPQETHMGSCKDAPNRQQYMLRGNYWKRGPGGLIAGYVFKPPLACSLQGLEPVDRYAYYKNDVKIYFDGNRFGWDGYVGKERFRRPNEAAEEPFDGFPPLTRHAAEEAYELILAQAGCLPRDAVSKRTRAEVRTGTGCWGRWGPDGGLLEGLPPAAKCPPDADRDGMPDAWEKAHKLDPNDPADASKIVPAGASKGDRHKGYTYIEYYINELADLKVAEALTQARLDPEPAKPWEKPANGLSVHTTHWQKSLDEMVAAIRCQNAEQKDLRDRKSYRDMVAAWQAIIRFDRMKEKAAPAVRELAKGLAKGKDDPQAVTFAAWALGAIGPAARDAVPDLIKALKSEQNTQRKGWTFQPYGYIAWALGRIGMNEQQAAEAVPALAKLLTGKDGGAPANAAWALSRVGKAAQPALPELLKVPGRKDVQYAGFFAAQALSHIGAPAVPGLVKALAGGDPHIRAAAARALGWIGPDAKEAAPALIETLGKNPAVPVRVAAAAALVGIAPESAAAHKALAGALADDHYGVRIGAAEALGQCGPAAATTITALEKAFEDKRVEVRRAAALALGRIGKAALPALTRALSDKDTSVRKYCARAIGNIGKDAGTAASALAGALVDKDAEVRREAAWSLALVGSSENTIRSALEKARTDNDYVVRFSAAAALERPSGK